MPLPMFSQISYAQRLGASLTNFKQTKPRLWTFAHSCETKHGAKQLKSRGNIFETPDGLRLVVKCHHCGMATSLDAFIRDVNPHLYDEYRMEAFRGTPEIVRVEPIVQQPPPIDATLDGLIPVVSLPKSSPVLRFLERRKIPTDKYELLYVAKHFYQWATLFKPEFKNIADRSPRLVMPYFDRNGRVIGLTARTFSPTVEPRYIHLRLDRNVDFIYGSERVDPSKTIYIVEGQIDSLFIQNTVAVGGANYGSDFVKSIKTNCVVIPDNDWQRNRQVGAQLKKAIDDGLAVCFLPDTVKGKDLNQLVQLGMSIPELKRLVDAHIFRGLAAQLEFALKRKF